MTRNSLARLTAIACLSLAAADQATAAEPRADCAGVGVQGSGVSLGRGRGPGVRGQQNPEPRTPNPEPRRAASPATNIKVVCDRWPDGSSLRQFALDAIRLSRARTEKQKALAVLRWMRRWTMFTNGTVPRERGRSILNDLKILHVYGAHWCDGRALCMENLWRSVGGRAYKLYVPPGFTMALVHWTDDDGVARWHQMHASRGWYVYDRAGRWVATPDQIGVDFSLMLRPTVTGMPRSGHPPRPWNWIAVGHRPFSTHNVALDLRPGEVYSRQWGNEGIPACNNIAEKQYDDGEHGPYPVVFGNGRFTSRIDLTSPELVTTAGGRCEVLWPVRLPHVIADARLEGDLPAGLKVQFGRDGKTFFDVPRTDRARVELGRKCGGAKNLLQRYEYVLKLSWPAEQRASGPAALLNVVQHNLFALPQLWPGRNRITVSADLPKGVALSVAYEWQDAAGEKRNVTRIEQTPYSYDILAAGGKWTDVRCKELTIAACPADGKGNRTVLKEPAARIEPLAALPTMDQIVGDRKPPPLKSVADYLADLKQPDKRIEALDGLMVLRDRSAGPALTALLYSDEEMPLAVRGRIVQAIFHSLERKAAFDVLLPVVAREEKVKWAKGGKGIGWKSISSLVAHLAGACNYQPAVPVLIDGFKRGVGQFNRPAYLRAFGRLKAREAVPLCVRALRWHSDVSAPAAEALGLIGDDSAVPALVRTVESRMKAKPFQAILYAEAGRALGRLNARGPAATGLLEKLLVHHDEEVRAAAGEALGKVGSAAHADALRAAAEKETFPWVRQLMLAAAKRTGRHESETTDGHGWARGDTDGHRIQTPPRAVAIATLARRRLAAGTSNGTTRDPPRHGPRLAGAPNSAVSGSPTPATVGGGPSPAEAGYGRAGGTPAAPIQARPLAAGTVPVASNGPPPAVAGYGRAGGVWDGALVGGDPWPAITSRSHKTLWSAEKARCQRPVFSPDGGRVAVFVTVGTESKLLVVPIDGGKARTVWSDAGAKVQCSQISFSPDGRQLAVLLRHEKDGKVRRSVAIGPVSGTLAWLGVEQMVYEFALSPACAAEARFGGRRPDGRRIALATRQGIVLCDTSRTAPGKGPRPLSKPGRSRPGLSPLQATGFGMVDPKEKLLLAGKGDVEQRAPYSKFHFSPDGSVLTAVARFQPPFNVQGQGAGVVVFVDEGKHVRLPVATPDLVISPDGQEVAGSVWTHSPVGVERPGGVMVWKVADLRAGKTRGRMVFDPKRFIAGLHTYPGAVFWTDGPLPAEAGFGRGPPIPTHRDWGPRAGGKLCCVATELTPEPNQPFRRFGVWQVPPDGEPKRITLIGPMPKRMWPDPAGRGRIFWRYGHLNGMYLLDEKTLLCRRFDDSLNTRTWTLSLSPDLKHLAVVKGPGLILHELGEGD